MPTTCLIYVWVGRHWFNPIIQNLEFKYPKWILNSNEYYEIDYI